MSNVHNSNGVYISPKFIQILLLSAYKLRYDIMPSKYLGIVFKAKKNPIEHVNINMYIYLCIVCHFHHASTSAYKAIQRVFYMPIANPVK